MIKVELDRAEEFTIRIKSKNNKELFRSSETYKRKKTALRAWDILQNSIALGEVEFSDLTEEKK